MLFGEGRGQEKKARGASPTVLRILDYFSPFPAEKAMAPHSNTPAWKIPWTEEPSGLQSMDSLRVGHDSVTSLSLFTLHWRRKWQPTLVFLPGESQGRGSLVGCRLWGRIESGMTKRLHFHFHFLPSQGLPWWLSDEESTCQCRRHGFNLWIRKIP